MVIGCITARRSDGSAAISVFATGFVAVVAVASPSFVHVEILGAVCRVTVVITKLNKYPLPDKAV